MLLWAELKIEPRVLEIATRTNVSLCEPYVGAHSSDDMENERALSHKQAEHAFSALLSRVRGELLC